MNENYENNHEELTRMVEPEIIKMGAINRIISIFIAPGELMKNVKAYPVILVPFLVSVILGLIAVAPNQTVSQLATIEMGNISIERFGVNLFDMDAAFDEYGDAGTAAAFDAFTMITLIATAVIGPLLLSLIYTIFLYVFSKIARGQTTFGQMYAMCMHVYVIAALGALISAVLMSATNSLVDLTSLAAVLMPNGRMDSFAFNFLNMISVFVIWDAIVTFIGVKVINEFSGLKAGVITAILFFGGVGVASALMMTTWWLMDIGMAALMY